jgi:hypothetical protein
VIRAIICNEFISKNFELNCSKFVVGMGFNNRDFCGGGGIGDLDTKELGGIDK